MRRSWLRIIRIAKPSRIGLADEELILRYVLEVLHVVALIGEGCNERYKHCKRDLRAHKFAVHAHMTRFLCFSRTYAAIFVLLTHRERNFSQAQSRNVQATEARLMQHHVQ